MARPPQKQTPQRSYTKRLLQLTDHLRLFLSPSRQPYVACSSIATPIYSEPFFDWLMVHSKRHLGQIPCPQQFGTIVSKLDARARLSAPKEPIHSRIAKIATKSYQLELGTAHQDVVNITGKKWKQSTNFAATFERLENFEKFTTPVQTSRSLGWCFEQAFKLNPEKANKLALWVAEALLPDQKPPILVITGKASQKAAAKLRNLIDPVTEPIIYTPQSWTELPRMAIDDKVLVFAPENPFTEKTLLKLRQIHQGARVAIRYCNRRLEKLNTTVQRTIMIASNEPMEISPGQLTIEINEAFDTSPGSDQLILGALLNLMVQIVGQPMEVPAPMAQAAASASTAPNSQPLQLDSS